MPARLEIALQDHLNDPEGEGIRKKAKAYFGIDVARIRTVKVLTIDAGIGTGQLARISMRSSPTRHRALLLPSAGGGVRLDYLGRFPAGGARQPGATAVEAIEDLLGIHFQSGEAVYLQALWPQRKGLSRRISADRR
jgi:phosphoribosylformylglycinamidine synthase